MEKIALEQLSLLDLRGNTVNLLECFGRYVLLIFLRHLA